MAVATFPNNSNSGQEISRLLTAAVVNKKFRNLLLAHPDQALAHGYNGETFQLAAEDRDRITSIRASNLTEFALQLTDWRASHASQPVLYSRPVALLYTSVGMD